MTIHPMATLFSTLQAFFAQFDWSVQVDKARHLLTMRYHGQNGDWSCYARVREAQHQFAFHSLYPQRIPQERRVEMALFITLANFGMIIGNFEMDLSDGELRFKTSIDVEGDRLTPALIGQMVFANLFMMDKYYPGIDQVIHSAPAQTAIELVEQPTKDR